jgi:hypothetical protein
MLEKNRPYQTLGYVRVSTCGQTLDARLQQLCAASCAKIYREKRARGVILKELAKSYKVGRANISRLGA